MAAIFAVLRRTWTNSETTRTNITVCLWSNV